jgi:hypothetical protein
VDCPPCPADSLTLMALMTVTDTVYLLLFFESFSTPSHPRDPAFIILQSHVIPDAYSLLSCVQRKYEWLDAAVKGRSVALRGSHEIEFQGIVPGQASLQLCQSSTGGPSRLTVECDIYGRFCEPYAHIWRDGRWPMYEEDLRESPDGRKALRAFFKIRENLLRCLYLKRQIRDQQPTSCM